MKADMITISVKVNASLEKTWTYWTDPAHITQWNFASKEWICPKAKNDLRPGGAFNWRMETKDASMGFDFTGTYEEVKAPDFIAYKMSDGRKVSIQFNDLGNEVVELIEAFEAEGTHSDEMQKAGWQAILNNFKKYVEG